jgi:chitinase
MSYDFINRRDTKTGHHAGSTVVQETLKAYTGFGIDKAKLNIGFPMYAKWFSLTSTCATAPYVGCDLGQHEYPNNGTDMENSGAVVFNYPLADNQARVAEFQVIDQNAHSDTTNHASTFVGSSEELGNIFWTWLSAADVAASCKANLPDAGGIMVWSINQDTNAAAGGPRFDALQQCLASA